MKIQAKVIPGHGAASGKKDDSRYPGGTIALQTPYFRKLGLDLSPYHSGTLNIDIAPYSYSIKKPKHFFEEVAWTTHIPPENFYFFDIALNHNGKSYQGLIYMPDPETKTEHEQAPTTLELILPKIEGIQYGDSVEIDINEQQLALQH